MPESQIIFPLALVTLLAVFVFAIVQSWRTKKASDRREGSVIGADHKDDISAKRQSKGFDTPENVEKGRSH
ncbi:hypothetical protein [Afifella marina]|uniref:Uncharacterized protein n=1 Tax=Afifella marina DSM 2698 TaxID=1120955 RepID=A0A1G5P2K9_AFIMA|nr:hypothetical protein [Afifella marina]MBK1624194.1 hypothetical protein [Afifella marina DSM 2698]MBK1627927.1 hypothetical protein [Afifella marina]MBK5918121.1 hypothetical protein [Afifella marina]RAI19179.1 hypothetical protein CH311_12720 [Afifella marina DSM 2698]SCZ43785.1 hypothetical protein SAMN03080610_03125 [Afifella marina DSM 2698]